MTFSIRAVLALTALNALFFAIYVVFPAWLAALALMLLAPMLTAGVLAGAIYGRGGLRAFCIGSLVVAVPMDFAVVVVIAIEYAVDVYRSAELDLASLKRDLDETAYYFKVTMILFLMTALPAGATGAFVAWLLRFGEERPRSEFRS